MDLVSFAHINGSAATRLLARKEQKSLGQFMTPPPIARFMAARTYSGAPRRRKIRILDPAAGSGVLAAALVEQILASDERPDELQIFLFEVDKRFHPVLRGLAERIRRECRDKGVAVSVNIRIEDFLLSDAVCDKPQFDVVIANPPYFKLNKSDVRSERHSYAVYGQPNIYGLFMAACARALNPSGRWCFITPRSWTNGPYFSMVRRQLFLHVHLDAIHIFESRQDHFTEDEILQEAMISWGTAQAVAGDTIFLSMSTGVHDLARASIQSLPTREIISLDPQKRIALPLDDGRGEINYFSDTLETLGLKVSTGPVVAFRASAYLEEDRVRNSVPMLWMQHIQHMRISWPLQKKREYIVANADTAWMLVPNGNMVVMRRFSPKEDVRRVTAAPYLEASLPGAVLGLENHTNYISRPGGRMSEREAKGLAAFLNSRQVDAYLRRVSGNTQVNASDLRKLPLPSRDVINEIGRLLAESSSLSDADQVVESILRTESRRQVSA